MLGPTEPKGRGWEGGKGIRQAKGAGRAHGKAKGVGCVVVGGRYGRWLEQGEEGKYNKGYRG